MATIKQISELSGVSRGTVDRVLNGRGHVSPEKERLVRSIAEQVGYKPNRAGKALAARLRGLFAHVTVAARKPEDRALAAALGCTPETVCLDPRGLAQYDCIFSTVPAPVFRAEHLAAMRPDCLIIDLASSPGGLPADTAPFDAPVYLPAPGLPGKTAPATAAALLYDHILAALAAAQP